MRPAFQSPSACGTPDRCRTSCRLHNACPETSHGPTGPLDPRTRLATRATRGLPRVRGNGHNSSGALYLACATGNDLPAASREPYTVRMIPHEQWIASDPNAPRKTSNSLSGERPWQPAQKPSSLHWKTVSLSSQRCRDVGKCSIFRVFVPRSEEHTSELQSQRY